MNIAFNREPVIGKKVLVTKDPRELTGFHTRDFSLEAEGYIHEVKDNTIVIDLATEGKGSGPFSDFPAKRVFYPRDW